MTYDAVILVPPPPASSVGAMAAAALLAGAGRQVALLEPSLDPGSVVEPFLLPLTAARQKDGADRLLPLVATAARLAPLEDLLEQPRVPCQLVLPGHRFDLATDPAAFAAEVAREWPGSASAFEALDERLDELGSVVAAAPSRLLAGPPAPLGQAMDLFAFLLHPTRWLKGRRTLRSALPDMADRPARVGLTAVTVGLGGLGRPPGCLGEVWRPWAAARRGAWPRPGAPGIAHQLRARAHAAGAVGVRYDPDVLRISSGRGRIELRLDGDATRIEAGMLVSGWPAAGLAPLVEGRIGARLASLGALAPPRRWAARLLVDAPAAVLPVGLGARVLLCAHPGSADGVPESPEPLLLEISPGGDGKVTLSLTALVGSPVAPSDLAARLRRRVEWLVPFLPPEAPARLTPPDARWPVRFAPFGARPLALPPLPMRGLALVGPDVAPILGAEGELLAALALLGAVPTARARGDGGRRGRAALGRAGPSGLSTTRQRGPAARI